MTGYQHQAPTALPSQSPLFHAEQSGRYERQELIRQYEAAYSCRLVVVIGPIFPPCVSPFEDLVYDADAGADLHLMLHSPGGDGETAVRITRAAQSRCRDLTVIVPDLAKSAATLIAVGAHHILMGPASDLGPIDPQFRFSDGALVAAKDIFAAVDEAVGKIQDSSDTAPLYAALLSNIDALTLQKARSELDGTDELLKEALRSNSDRSDADVEKLHESLKEPLITRPMTHSALFGVQDAKAAGLPVIEANLQGEQWQMLWRLWAKYYALGAFDGTNLFYESQRVSHVFNPGG